MEYKNIRLIYFSPTQTTKKIVEAIAKGISLNETKHCDITPFIFDEKYCEEIINELVIIGVPVYSGRVPLHAADRLRKLKGSNSPAIIVVVYGNRAYDDALLELSNIALERGFKPFAAAAFIGEHSFSSEFFPIAQGRPDADDLNKAAEFGMKINNIIQDCKPFTYLVNIPGKFPYKPSGKLPNISPISIESKCKKCGNCVSNCPTGSIRLNGKIETNKTTCSLCCACVKNCINKARVNDSDLVRLGSDWLLKNCASRKAPEIFIPD